MSIRTTSPLLVAALVGWAAETTAQTPERPERSQMKPAEKPAGTEVGSRAEVKPVQEALRDNGQDPGPIDGIMGPRTKAAVKNFQRAEGLPETGRLDAETMTKLGAKGTPSERRMEKTPQEQTEKTPQEKKPY